MKNFNKEAFKNLEKLCRIKCTPEEETALSKDIENIIKLVEELNELDTTNIEPTSYIHSQMQQNTFRYDRPKNTLTREEFLKNAPDQVAGMIKVPSIFKNQE